MKKLLKSTLPDNHSFDDLECFGPPSTKDGEFSGTKMADFGCFTQDQKDSNKYYHACVCKSKKNNNWFCFYQWGRVGNAKFDYQMVECSSEQEAQSVYEKQCHSKNDKRGEWYQHPQLGKMLRAKKNKDCYLVRNMATRLSALPAVAKITTKKPTAKSSQFDQQTEDLLRDLQVGTVSYAKSQFSSGMVPDLDSITQARTILTLAAKTKKDSELNELTKILYSKIPKSTHLGEKVELSSENIKSWYDDLDAFESAFNSLDGGTNDFNIKYLLKYLDKSNQLWYNIERLVKSSTRNRHSYIPGDIKIENIWEVTNVPKEFLEEQERVAKEFKGTSFPLIFQPERTDLEQRSNTQLLFHGSRSVNIGKILDTGYKLPKELSGVQINGWANGPGIYHGSDWRKSAGYCSIPNSYWAKGSGVISERKAFMFINDVILGNSHIISIPKAYENPPNGFHSVIADTKGSFQNEEFMSYHKKFVWPRFLFEFMV